MKKTTLGVLIALAIGINTTIWLRLKGHPGIFAENGSMENFQAVFLTTSFLLWLFASFASKSRAEKILLISLALFSLSFLVLEVDTRKLGIPILPKIFHGPVRNAWLGALWLAVGWFFFKNAKPIWNEFLHWVKTSSAIPMIISGFFWIASGLNDKSLVGRKNLYFEELMEVNSTLLMLLSAILFLLRKPELKEEIKCFGVCFGVSPK
jgi:hypothetical protein